MTTSTFTHALLDFEGQIIKKYRWTKSEARWYSNNHPNDTLIELDQPKQETESCKFNRLIKEVGECLI